MDEPTIDWMAVRSYRRRPSYDRSVAWRQHYHARFPDEAEWYIPTGPGEMALLRRVLPKKRCQRQEYFHFRVAGDPSTCCRPWQALTLAKYYPFQDAANREDIQREYDMAAPVVRGYVFRSPWPEISLTELLRYAEMLVIESHPAKNVRLKSRQARRAGQAQRSLESALTWVLAHRDEAVAWAALRALAGM